MDFEFKSRLSDHERDEIVALYDSLEYVAIEQFPDWAQVVPFSGATTHFTARDGGVLKVYALIFERVVGIARIDFGPIFSDADALIASLTEIRSHYRAAGVCAVRVQLGFPAGNESRRVEEGLRGMKGIRFSRHADDRWNSVVIDLRQHIEAIYGAFSQGHKRAIRKSDKLGLTVAPVAGDDELDSFVDIFVRMHKARALPIAPAHQRLMFGRLLEFLSAQRRGHILVVKDGAGTVHGGVVLIKQGPTVRYFKGAADPAQRGHPVLHAAFFEAFKVAQNMGARRFDLWGYSLDAKQGSQKHNINRFKSGFRGQPISYPNAMYFVNKPIRYFLLKTLLPVIEPYKTPLRRLLGR